MNPNPLKQGALTDNSTGLGTVTRKMVRERAVELAVINGRSVHDVSKSDWEQAKRELTGRPDSDPKEAALESAPNRNAGVPCPVPPDIKYRCPPAKMRMTRGAATMKSS
jgi:hypothetical protein